MRVLDLFCKAGGAAMGLHHAWPGAEIVGVDIEPQPRYPFTFILADAMVFPLEGYDFIWASPPCQRYSPMTMCRPGRNGHYPDLIAPCRSRFEATNVPFVIENVPGAPLDHPIILCGTMFNLPLYRHRLFECSFHVFPPHHQKHKTKGGRAGHWKPGEIVSVCGNCAPIRLARTAMGIDWMNRAELSQAVPPAYSEFIARQFFDIPACRRPEPALLARPSVPPIQGLPPAKFPPEPPCGPGVAVYGRRLMGANRPRSCGVAK